MKNQLFDKEIMDNWTFLAISSWFILWSSIVFYNVFNWNLAVPANLILMVYGCVFGAIVIYRWFEKKR